MKRMTLLCTVLLGFGLLCAQQPVLLRNSQFLDYEGHNVKLPNGNTMVFWNDTSSGSSDILAQKISPEGTVLWSAPRVVANGSQEQMIQSVTLTSDQNIAVLYYQFSLAQGGYSFQVQRFSQAGQRLWGDQGVSVIGNETYYSNVQMVPNSVGGVFVLFRDSSTYGMNLDASGTNLWPLMPLPGYSNVYKMEAVVDGTGGVIINYLSYTGGQGTHNQLVRLDAAGDIVGSNPMLSPNAPVPAGYSIINDLNGGFILYTRATNGISLQRMDVNGSLLLPSVTTVSALGQESISDVQIAANPDGGVSLAYIYSTDVDNGNLRVIKLGPNLQPAWNQPVSVELAGMSNYLNIDTANGIWCTMITWTSNMYDSDAAVYCCKVSEAGYMEFAPANVSNFTNHQMFPVVTSTPTKATLVWGEYAGSTNGIREQVVNNLGGILLPAGGRSVYGVLNGGTELMNTLNIGNTFIHIYEDSRNGWESKVYYQITDANASPVLESGGSALCPPCTYPEDYVDSMVTDEGSVAVLYSVYDGSVFDLYYNEFSTSGYLAWPGYGISVVQDSESSPINAKLGKIDGDIFVAWSEYSPDYVFSSIKGQRFHQGQAQWSEGGKLLVNAGGDYISLRELIGDYLVYGRENYNVWNVSIDALKLAPNGDPYPGWTAGSVHVFPPTTDYLQYQHCGVVNGNLAVFATNTDSETMSLLGQLVSPSAQLLWGTDGVQFCQNNEMLFTYVTDAVYDDDITLLLYNDGANQLSIQKLNQNGQLLFTENGIPIDVSSSNMHNSKLVRYDNGTYSVIVVQYEDNLCNMLRFDLSATGEQISTSPLSIMDNRYSITNLKIAKNGNNAIVAWNDALFYERGESIELNSLWNCRLDASPVSVDDPLPIPVVNYAKNYPNPFLESTTISFGLKNAAPVQVDIYNLRGQHVRSLMNEAKAPGNYELNWDGRDMHGKSVADGVYFFKIQAGSFSSRKKMILLK